MLHFGIIEYACIQVVLSQKVVTKRDAAASTITIKISFSVLVMLAFFQVEDFIMHEWIR